MIPELMFVAPPPQVTWQICHNRCIVLPAALGWDFVKQKALNSLKFLSREKLTSKRDE